MKRILGIALVIFIVAPGFHAAAAPKAKSADECAVFADLGLVAAALSKQKVERARLEAALSDIYDFQAEDARTIARLIVDAAYQAVAQRVAPIDFTRALLGACLRGEGDMDAILGTGT